MGDVLTGTSATPSPSPTLTARQDRERRYYDEFVKRTPARVAALEAIRGERRPWNPYWYVAELVLERFNNRSQRLLDFGCGPGTYAVQFAHIGYQVYGFDISPSNIRAAEELAASYHVDDRTHFSAGQAEQLNYPSDYFDTIVGIDILHHVEIKPAMSECLRVLKPGGVAIFKEPIEAPWFDRLRNTRLGLALRSKDASFERHVTQDERKLTAEDLGAIRALCRVDERRFRLVSRLETFVGRGLYTASGASRLEMLDAWLLENCSSLKPLAGSVVITCRAKADA
jgi:SAM-dependent methyltransferase